MIAGGGEAHLRVHVRPIHIDLPAIVMHDLADLDDVLLKDAMRRGIGDHRRREGVAILLRLGAHVVHVDIAIIITGDDNDLHARP